MRNASALPNCTKLYYLQFGSDVEQSKTWPQAGRHILAHFDDETIIVYQAYSPIIGEFAVQHGYFDDASEAIRIEPTRSDFYGRRAKLYRALGRTSEAIADFKMAIQISPGIL